MKQLRPAQYDALERAILDGRRVAIRRRGTEYVVVPQRIAPRGTRESLEALHPATGDKVSFWLDEVDALEIVG